MFCDHVTMSCLFSHKIPSYSPLFVHIAVKHFLNECYASGTVLSPIDTKKSYSQAYRLAGATDCSNHRNTMANWERRWKEKNRQLWEHEGPDPIRSPKKAALPKWLNRSPKEGEEVAIWKLPGCKEGSGRVRSLHRPFPFRAFVSLSLNPNRGCRLPLRPHMCVGSCANCKH